MSGSDSSGEEGDTDRIKEAVWTFDKAGEKSSLHTMRMKPVEHKHDGNELNTTPEFRTHISKKLSAMLDSWIGEVKCETTESKPDESETCDENDGFRLFSTSLPGNWEEEPKLTVPPKRRPLPSSSDSDSEMEERLRAAAVSLSDLIPTVHSSTRPQEDRWTNSEERTALKKKEKVSSKEGKGKEMSFQPGHKAALQEERMVEGHGKGDDVLKKKKKKKKLKLDKASMNE